MNEPFDSLMEALKIEEDSIRTDLRSDRLGLFLVYALREYDWFFNKLKEHRGDGTSSDLEEMHYFLRIGLPRAIAITLTNHENYLHPIVTPAHNEYMAKKAMEILTKLGFIEHGRRLAIAAKLGEIEIRKNSRTSYDFILPKSHIDFDFYEESVENHFTEQHRNILLKSYAASEITRGLEADISRVAREKVYAFKEIFIGYDAHPMLDDHFFGLGYFYVASNAIFDSFKFDLTFGGVSYLKYVLATAYIYSLSLKHERFCRELMIKHSGIRPQNILTISSEKDGFIESIGRALDMYGPSFQGYTFTNAEELALIYKVLSVRRYNLELLKPNGAPVPMIVEFSETGILRCLAGAQENPLQNLLNGLRHHFPREYSVNQQSREHSFQRAVERILQGSFNGLVFRQNVRIRNSGRDITDIDLSVAHPQTNTVLLLQLKAQDSFGSEVNARVNRTRRFKKESSKWIQAVSSWISEAGAKEVRFRLGLPASPEAIRPYLIVLSKNFAHFGFENSTPANVTFCTWHQFYNAVLKTENRHGQLRTLEALFASIVGDEIRKYARPTQWNERRIVFDHVEYTTLNS